MIIEACPMANLMELIPGVVRPGQWASIHQTKGLRRRDIWYRDNDVFDAQIFQR